MTIPPTDEFTIDPSAAGFFADPYPHYAPFRAHRPVHRDPRGMWMVFCFDGVRKVLRDPAISSRLANAPGTERTKRLVAAWGDGILTHPHLSRADPPEHTRLRRVLARAFTPRIIDDLRPRMRTIIDDLLSSASLDDVDVVSQLGRPLPYQVMCGLLGFPPGADDSLLIECSHAFVSVTMEPFLSSIDVAEVMRLNTLLTEHIRAAVEWKRDNLGDDLMSLLLSAEGDDDDALTTEEVVEQVRLLFAAGHETTVNAIGNAMLALLRHPEQWALLVEDPSRVENGIEELLRYDNTIQIAWRTTPTDFVVGDVTIPAGNDVVGWVGSANRDPAKWGESADELDVLRPAARDHLSFGSGPHLCLGAWLARAEMQELFRALVIRFPRSELCSEELAWKQLVAVRGLENLHVRLRA